MAYASNAVAGDNPILVTATVDEIRYQYARRVGAGVYSNVLSDGSPISLPITLLCEGSTSNDFIQSGAFDNVAWSFNNNTISPNYASAPDGVLAADKNIPNGAVSYHRGQQTRSVTSGTTYTTSFFVKVAGYNYIQLFGNTGFDSVDTWVNFNLTNGTMGHKGPGNFTYSISPQLATGWYRISLTATATSTSATGAMAIAVMNVDYDGRVPLYTFSGDLTSGIYMWGGQFEAKNYLSSYRSTASAPVTRAADSLSFTNLSWYNPDQGTFVITASGSAFSAPYNLGGLNQTLDTTSKYALYYNFSSKSGSTYLVNANTLSSPTEFTGITNPTTLFLSSGGVANISRISYYPKALKPNKLAGLL
jgi:hypothetical protein